ncbi:hypothetical protein DAPPUDRAFT_248419 [Daphnia pulex]|uniref:Uncharacterized protein n=1 Tax=Daphnia pulex TaxID=6669 RepID=E9GUM3_DAPPU|nr:hypothetical protein DAPPUDRAFT_248419 [Daphnia pulex]|eukprot:EFX76755.1 hypothetical protein DAPPUDRAFT_248419 [Daphnia pulex]
MLGTEDVPNGRRRDPDEPPGFRPIYGNTIFGAPDRWPLVTRLIVPILCALSPPAELQKRAPFSIKIRPEQKRKRNQLRLEGKIPPWTGPIREPLRKNTREGRREEYRNRPIVPQRPVEPFLGPVILDSPEQAEANLRRTLNRLNAAAPPPRTFFPTPAQIAEFQSQSSAPPVQDFRITKGLFHSPKYHHLIAPVQAAVEVEEEGAVGGTEEKEEGAVGGETSEEDDTLQMLCESLSIEETTPAPIPPTPIQTEPTRQGRSRGRGLLMFSRESLEEAFKESPRERSKSRIAWIRRLAEQ